MMTGIQRIQWRRGSAAAWTIANSILSVGEPGFETDTGRFKIGDGVHTWNALDYAVVDSGPGLTAGAVTTPILADGSVTAQKVAADVVTVAAGDTRYPRFQSILAYGASPSGGDVDAGDSLDQALEDALNAGQAFAFVPMGTYRLKRTYNPSDQTVPFPQRPLLKRMRGFSWFGGWGKIGYPPSGGNQFYAAPELVWYGPAGQPMWELDSIVGAAILGIAFRGRVNTAASNKASVGINVSQRGSIAGSGLHLFERLSFSDLEVGARFGEGQVTGGGNCDTTTFRDCNWQGVGIALHLVHQQALVYNFAGTSSFTACPVIVKTDAGGYFNIDDLNANGSGGTGPDDWMFDLVGGKNIGTHKISRGRLEGNCKQVLRTRSRYAEVLFEGLTEAQDSQGVTMFDLTGGQVTFIGGKLITHSADNPTFNLKLDGGSGGVPSVRLYGVRLDTIRFRYNEWFTHTTSSVPTVTLRDCENANGQRIPSFSTRLEDGLPVPLEATTTDATTDVSTTLLGNGDANRQDNCCAVPAGAYRIRMTLVGTVGVNNVSALQVRAVRELDVQNVVGVGLTLRGSIETIGTDYNPDSLTYSLQVAGVQQHLRAVVRGKAATTIQWRAEFRLVGGVNDLVLPPVP